MDPIEFIILFWVVGMMIGVIALEFLLLLMVLLKVGEKILSRQTKI